MNTNNTNNMNGIVNHVGDIMELSKDIQLEAAKYIYLFKEMYISNEIDRYLEEREFDKVRECLELR